MSGEEETQTFASIHACFFLSPFHSSHLTKIALFGRQNVYMPMFQHGLIKMGFKTQPTKSFTIVLAYLPSTFGSCIIICSDRKHIYFLTSIYWSDSMSTVFFSEKSFNFFLTQKRLLLNLSHNNQIILNLDVIVCNDRQIRLDLSRGRQGGGRKGGGVVSGLSLCEWMRLAPTKPTVFLLHISNICSLSV